MGRFRSTLRFLHTGVYSPADKTVADAATDQPGIPVDSPVDTEIPWVIPWEEGLEDTEAGTGLMSSANPSLPQPDLGAKSIVGAYEGAVRTRGPTSFWNGQEVSGGPWGDQATGRRMLFKLPLVMSNPDAQQEAKVTDTGWQDELAAAIANNGQGEVTDAQITQRLLLWEGDTGP